MNKYLTDWRPSSTYLNVQTSESTGVAGMIMTWDCNRPYQPRNRTAAVVGHATVQATSPPPQRKNSAGPKTIYIRLCGHAPVASYLAPFGDPALLMAVSHVCHSPLFPVQALIMLCGAHSSDLPLRRKANACAWSVFA